MVKRPTPLSSSARKRRGTNSISTFTSSSQESDTSPTMKKQHFASSLSDDSPTSSASSISKASGVSKQSSESGSSLPPQPSASESILESSSSSETITNFMAKGPDIPRTDSSTSPYECGTMVKAAELSTGVDVEKANEPLRPSPREPSHDGTVILPALPKRPLEVSSGALIPFQPADAFPIFTNGDVTIKTELSSPPMTFQLHSSVLSRHSPWFACQMKASDSDSLPTWYLYTIDEADNGKVSLLSRSTESERPRICQREPHTVEDVVIKIEDTSDEVPMASLSPAKTTPLPRKTTSNAAAAVRCYTQIFGTFYSIPPQISSANIIAALVQTESLVKTATELGSLHLLRPYIGNVFSQYRQGLFLAIKADPARWCLLAIPLKNQSIYTECLIHLIGAHPYWNPTWPTKRAALPEDIRDLIKRKSEDIEPKRIEVERDILLTSIPYGRKGLPLDPTDKSQIETWLTVSVFRDQIAQHMNKFDHRTRELSSWGSFFRGLSKGSLPCLETEHIKKICQGTMNSHWNDLSEDLRRLKDHAAKLVKDLARNELMIDPDANGVDYLTCAKIRNEDIPWLAAAPTS